MEGADIHLQEGADFVNVRSIFIAGFLSITFHGEDLLNLSRVIDATEVGMGIATINRKNHCSSSSVLVR